MNTTFVPIRPNNAVQSSLLAMQNIRRQTIRLLAVFSFLWILMPGSLYTLLDSYATGADPSTAFIAYIVFVTVFFFWMVFAFNDRLNIAAYGLATTLVLITPLSQTTNRLDAILAIVVISTVVPNMFSVIVYEAFLIGSIGVFAGLGIFGGESLESVLNDLSLVIMLAVVGVTLRFFARSIRQTVEQAEQRSELLRIGAEVGQVISGIVSMNELLPRAVEFIRDRFGFYHVQVFLIDDSGDIAVLRASTGEVGKLLLERKHRLNVGSNSVIGQATLTGEPVRTDDTERAGVHYRNELLPNTRAELAIPIKDGERIIGALDVQSTEVNAFDLEQQQALQIMTNLLASAIRNARLFEEQNRNMQENQRLFIQAEANLREIQRLNRQLTKESWERFSQERGERSGITLEGNRITRNTDWSELLMQAIKMRQAIVNTAGDSTVVAQPILLRGETIGAIEIEPNANFDENDMLEILRAVSERLAVSLDNARLFEESQESSLYEQRINHIVGLYQNANTVDELLQVTLTELSQTLGAARASIRLTPMETPDDTVNEASVS